MKKTLLIVFVLTASLSFFTGCKSEQFKDFETIQDTKDLCVLRDFYTKYNGQLENQVKDRYNAAVDALVLDSTLYAAVTSASSFLERFNAEKEYVQGMADGRYFSEVYDDYLQHKEKAESMLGKIDEMTRVFKNYKFHQSMPSGDTGDFEFDIPDQSGKGSVKVSLEPLPVKMQYWGVHRYGIIHRHCTATYSLTEDMKIKVVVEEKRSYARHPSANEYGEEKTKELISDLKRNFPTPKPMSILLSLSPGGDDEFPYMNGVDNRNEIHVLTAALR